MKEKNDYGFYSGGYIFDRLDRTALKAIRKQYGLSPATQLYTANATITFMHQLCDIKKSRCFFGDIEVMGDGSYQISVRLHQAQTCIASATFWFKKAKHNYCETQGENK